MLGSEVLRRLKASTLTAAIPVVVLSGDSGRHHTDELMELGAAEFLAKPFDIHRLVALIDLYCA
jgi:DNA-binding response OmpR family regulator